MQQRHFEAIAETLKRIEEEAEVWDSAHGRAVLEALPFIRERFADMCAREYTGAYAFKRQKFLAACQKKAV